MGLGRLKIRTAIALKSDIKELSEKFGLNMRIKQHMPRPNRNKTRVNITINRDILEASRKYIPNLSDFVEKKLLEFLEFVNHPIEKSMLCGRRDSNPGNGLGRPVSYR